MAADEAAARKVVEETIEKFADRLDADEVIVCLSDDFSSYRKDRVKSDYKAIRNDVERPVHLYDIKEWMAETYTTERWTSLEADDVMGILATDPSATDERIIVSADKDMMTVPAKLYRPQEDLWHPTKRPKHPPIHDITVEQADRFHLWQTIVGDTTDGYTGLPGAGPMAAEKLLDGLGWESFQHVLKSGPRKGEEETRWRRVQMASPWEAVVSAYAKAGLTEADAVTQARLARILRYGEWDGRSPLLWSPPTR